MPGTLIIKPIEAELTHNTELIGKMSPYCLISAGTRRFKTEICKKGGKHPSWDTPIIIPVDHNQTHLANVLVQLIDDQKLTHHDDIGYCMIDLNDIENKGSTSEWYELHFKNKPAGKILLDIAYQSGTPSQEFLNKAAPRDQHYIVPPYHNSP